MSNKQQSKTLTNTGKNKGLSTEQSKQTVQEFSETRRDFIKKYGALAAVTPVALTLTMQTNKALASSVCTECGP
jgi:hypothetical protein